jgi:hypothetical protein
MPSEGAHEARYDGNELGVARDVPRARLPFGYSFI